MAKNKPLKIQNLKKKFDTNTKIYNKSFINSSENTLAFHINRRKIIRYKR